MKIAFVIYRQWAFEIFKNISSFGNVFLITTKKAEFSLSEARKYTKVELVEGYNNGKIYELLKKNKIDVVFFYGWSWIVEDKILDNFLCICLHPSPLPKYKGGSPIQHQILNKEKRSAVSVFKMTQGIDTGDIYLQLPMSLSGDINDIFNRMINLGTKITKKFLLDYKKGRVELVAQKNLDKYPVFKRRKPEDSEIKESSLKNMTFKDLYNLVRCLSDPYPNAYIVSGNEKISILKIKKIKNKITEENIIISKHGIILKLKDGFARIEECRILKVNL
ncbi:MAG: formyltransferase family protein [Candidatus Daviesbacteria bacterium]|nr:formyltransferase family protein [Candidatus Daviesbacteria bacterium]